MTRDKIELVVTILIFGIALIFVRQLNKGRKKGELRNYYMGEGQFLDVNSISGNVHGIVLGFLVCFVGWHLDEMAHWLWQQFGNELIVSPGKEAWHRIVSTTIGVILIVSAFLQLIFLIRRYRRKVKEDEIEQLRKFHDSGK